MIGTSRVSLAKGNEQNSPGHALRPDCEKIPSYHGRVREGGVGLSLQAGRSAPS